MSDLLLFLPLVAILAFIALLFTGCFDPPPTHDDWDDK
jgi:hypothetical protein